MAGWVRERGRARADLPREPREYTQRMVRGKYLFSPGATRPWYERRRRRGRLIAREKPADERAAAADGPKRLTLRGAVPFFLLSVICCRECTVGIDLGKDSLAWWTQSLIFFLLRPSYDAWEWVRAPVQRVCGAEREREVGWCEGFLSLIDRSWWSCCIVALNGKVVKTRGISLWRGGVWDVEKWLVIRLESCTPVRIAKFSMVNEVCWQHAPFLQAEPLKLSWVSAKTLIAKLISELQDSEWRIHSPLNSDWVITWNWDTYCRHIGSVILNYMMTFVSSNPEHRPSAHIYNFLFSGVINDLVCEIPMGMQPPCRIDHLEFETTLFLCATAWRSTTTMSQVGFHLILFNHI